MDEVRTRERPQQSAPSVAAPRAYPVATPPAGPSRLRAVPVLLTLGAVVLAGLLAWAAWDVYMVAPWTRDGTVRAYVVTEASEVSGRIVRLAVHADQVVHKGDLLVEIDPTDYRIAVANAEAGEQQAKASFENSQREAARRATLGTLSTSVEEKQTYITNAQTAAAAQQRALAALAQARVNLERTRIVSQVDGYVTNLTAQVGDYVGVGERVISLTDADSFWVDGYFEETQLGGIRIGDPARVSLMGYRGFLHGHVAGITRAIAVANAQADTAGIASVNPVFTWIRLAQRIPVRIALDAVPADVTLVAGMTATVQIESTRRSQPARGSVTPIIAPSSTSDASRAASQPSVPAGRSGSTIQR